jgi:uncharacterized damage-inducible protein DinB
MHRMYKMITLNLPAHTGTVILDEARILSVSSLTEALNDTVLNEIEKRFRSIKSTADRALEQVRGEDLFLEFDEGSNSLAIIMKHVAGNMLHTWVDPFTPTEEKPDRKRDTEFVTEEGDPAETIRERWGAGWRALFEAMEIFRGEKLTRTLRSRWRDYTLLEFLSRQVVHYAQHTGQIVFLAKHIRGRDWETLSIPKGKSREFNERLRKERTGRS